MESQREILDGYAAPFWVQSKWNVGFGSGAATTAQNGEDRSDQPVPIPTQKNTA